jgi:hypothetical protein
MRAPEVRLGVVSFSWKAPFGGRFLRKRLWSPSCDDQQRFALVECPGNLSAKGLEEAFHAAAWGGTPY